MRTKEEGEKLIWSMIKGLSYVLVLTTLFLVLLGSTTLIWIVFPIIYVCVGGCALLSISCVIAIGVLYFAMEIFLHDDPVYDDVK